MTQYTYITLLLLVLTIGRFKTIKMRLQQRLYEKIDFFPIVSQSQITKNCCLKFHRIYNFLR